MSEEYANWMSDCVNFIPKFVSVISFGNSQLEIPCNERDEITLAIHTSDFDASEKDTFQILQNIISTLGNIRAIRVFWFPIRGTFIFPQLLKKSVKEIHILRHLKDSDLLSSLPDIDEARRFQTRWRVLVGGDFARQAG